VVARLVRAALANSTVVLVLAAAVVAAGVAAARHAPLDVFPEFAPPIVEVQTEAPGLAAEDVEALVTVPLERALGGVPLVVTVRSSSALGISVVTVVFAYGTDRERARQSVIERVALAAPSLPRGVTPAVPPLASVLAWVLAIGLRAGPDVSPLALRDLAEWTIRPRLLAVPGVANVIIYGGGVREVQVTTSLERLLTAGVTLDDLVTAVSAGDAAAGSGFLDRPGQRFLTWFDGRLRSAADVARAPLPTSDGTPVPLAAVADVADGAAVPVGDAVVNAEPGVLLMVSRQPDVNVVEVTAGVEDALRGIVRALPPGIRVDEALFRQASFVEHALANLGRALLAGAVLVVVVLLLFLGHLRAAIISVLAIPLSLLAAVTVLHAFGQSLNVMVLGGLAIAVGEVVDDAIIDVENAWRRLRCAPPGAAAADVVLAASVEVRSAVVFATVIVALVFVPIFFLGGLEGALFRPLAVAYVLATLASLAVALTVTPVLALLLLPGAVARADQPPRLLQALRGRYERALARALHRPGRILGASALALAVGVALVPLLRLEFLPAFHETNFIMHMTGAPGVGLDESRRVAIAAERALGDVPGVRSVTQFIGRTALAEDSGFGVERSELLLRLDAGADAAAVTEAARARAGAITGFAFDVKQFLNERIEETIEGAGAAIVVRLRGTDLVALDEAARRLADRLAAIPGAVDVHAETALAAPGVRIRPRRDDMLRLGATAAVVERAVRSALGGLPVARIVRPDWQADVVVRVSGADDPARLVRLPVAGSGGRALALGSVADVELAPLRADIVHEDGVRTTRVRLNVRGAALEDVARAAERAVAETALPGGVYAEVGGEYTAAASARVRLAELGALAVAGIFVLLLLDFGSVRLAGLTMLNVPLAFVGAIAAVLIGAGGRLSLGAIVGFVTVFGITIRNGIVLVAHFLNLERARGRALDPVTLVGGAGDRLAPILMTALTTGIALVPLLFLGGRPGGEIEQPMALVIVGGLFTSTWLNLFVVPLWYARGGRGT
jgi:CzcA family heavy metal efflux pump